jgi:cytochrome c oxidase subunit 2
MTARLWGASALAALLTGGCEGIQSALDPAGAQAERLAEIWWVMLAVLMAIYAIVLVCLAVAALRRRRENLSGMVVPPDQQADRGIGRLLGLGIVLSAITLLSLTAYSYHTDRRLFDLADRTEMTIEVTGLQWWWKVRYLDEVPSRSFTTANEIRVPVGVPVRILLKSQDVIHSFWVPNLHGKLDLIPGRDNEIHIVADRAGVYRGQCAEFCGIQHAHMAFEVIAEPREAFEAWRAAQIAPAPDPADDQQKQGQDLFLHSACVMCHSIRGTTAAASVAPDLTHLASRGTLAAGTLPYNRGNLAAWIVDPQSIKPGNHMPLVSLSPSDLQALLAYLDSLK